MRRPLWKQSIAENDEMPGIFFSAHSFPRGKGFVRAIPVTAIPCHCGMGCSKAYKSNENDREIYKAAEIKSIKMKRRLCPYGLINGLCPVKGTGKIFIGPQAHAWPIIPKYLWEKRAQNMKSRNFRQVYFSLPFEENDDRNDVFADFFFEYAKLFYLTAELICILRLSALTLR